MNNLFIECICFSFRLNSLEYRDLKDKLQTPIRNARNIVIRQSLSDQFLETFREQVDINQVFRLPGNMVSLKYKNTVTLI